MSEHEVDVLNLVDAVVWDDDTEVHEVLQIASVEPGQAHRNGPSRSCHLDAVEHVGSLAAAADADDDVSRLDLVFQLLSEYVLV